MMNVNLGIGLFLYYRGRFNQKEIKALTVPIFQGSGAGADSAGGMQAVGEMKNRQQLAVLLQPRGQSTLVTIRVLGKSMFFLPS